MPAMPVDIPADGAQHCPQGKALSMNDFDIACVRTGHKSL